MGGVGRKDRRERGKQTSDMMGAPTPSSGEMASQVCRNVETHYILPFKREASKPSVTYSVDCFRPHG